MVPGPSPCWPEILPQMGWGHCQLRGMQVLCMITCENICLLRGAFGLMRHEMWPRMTRSGVGGCVKVSTPDNKGTSEAFALSDWSFSEALLGDVLSPLGLRCVTFHVLPGLCGDTCGMGCELDDS